MAVEDPPEMVKNQERDLKETTGIDQRDHTTLPQMSIDLKEVPSEVEAAEEVEAEATDQWVIDQETTKKITAVKPTSEEEPEAETQMKPETDAFRLRQISLFI